MPHFTIEYSPNLKHEIDFDAFCETIREAASRVETFPTAGIRVRAFCADHYAMADGNPKHGYVDMSIRLREGRPQDVKEAATKVIFEAAQSFLTLYMENHSLALSLEMRDIDANLSPKTGTVRAHMNPES